MTESEAIDRFGRLSVYDKVIVLVDVMHELTIVVRSLFHDFADEPDKAARSVYKISELNHRLTSAAFELLTHKPSYPDDVLIEMLWRRPDAPELDQYFPFVLKQALQRAGARTVRSA